MNQKVQHINNNPLNRNTQRSVNLLIGGSLKMLKCEYFKKKIINLVCTNTEKSEG